MVCLYEMFFVSLHTFERSAFLQAGLSLTDVDFTRSRQKRASRATECSHLAEPAAHRKDTLESGSQVSLSCQYPGFSRERSHFPLSPLPTSPSTCFLSLSPSRSSCTDPAPACGPGPACSARSDHHSPIASSQVRDLLLPSDLFLLACKDGRACPPLKQHSLWPLFTFFRFCC